MTVPVVSAISEPAMVATVVPAVVPVGVAAIVATPIVPAIVAITIARSITITAPLVRFSVPTIVRRPPIQVLVPLALAVVDLRPSVKILIPLPVPRSGCTFQFTDRRLAAKGRGHPTRTWLRACRSVHPRLRFDRARLRAGGARAVRPTRLHLDARRRLRCTRPASLRPLFFLCGHRCGESQHQRDTYERRQSSGGRSQHDEPPFQQRRRSSFPVRLANNVVTCDSLASRRVKRPFCEQIGCGGRAAKMNISPPPILDVKNLSRVRMPPKHLTTTGFSRTPKRRHCAVRPRGYGLGIRGKSGSSCNAYYPNMCASDPRLVSPRHVRAAARAAPKLLGLSLAGPDCNVPTRIGV